MKKIMKLPALLLAAAIALSVTACAGGKKGNFGEAQTPDIDPESPTGTINWLMYEDLLKNNAKMVALFEERYGGEITQEITSSGTAYFDRLGTRIATGDSPDIVRYEWKAFPHGMSYNMFTPLDKYIDLNSELWADIKDVAEQYSYNGKHYYVPYQLKTNFALNYNNAALQANGLKDPMELYQKNEWTWSAFEALLKQWCDMSPDHIGYNGVGGMSFVLTTGTKTIDIKDGEIINNLRNENVQRCMTWVEDMRKEGLLGANADQVLAGAVSGFVSPDQAFVDGNLLFLGMDPSWAYGTAKQYLDEHNVENEIKFVPYPRDDLSDTYYHGVDTYGYMIPSGAPNIKGALDWIELNRVEETDENNIAKAKDDAVSDTVEYFPKCTCGHVFTDEENESGVSVCPDCETPRTERYKVVWTEEQYDLWMELRGGEGSRFTLLFDNCYGFGEDLTKLLQGGDTPILDGPVFHDVNYANAVESLWNSVEAVIQPYRDRMAADAKGETIETTPPAE